MIGDRRFYSFKSPIEQIGLRYKVKDKKNHLTGGGGKGV
jgi:hypothetical protein